MSNHTIWESKKLVRTYSNIGNHLQKPEQTIFNLLQKELNQKSMLDIGIGTGRTTAYFANKVKNYTGVDYSERMIATCKQQFANEKSLNFQVADARQLKDFEAASFDLVLFSYNGLDYINNEDRLAALQEINRVLKPNGQFIFSTHNLKGVVHLDFLNASKSFNPKEIGIKAIQYTLFSLLNPSNKKLQQRDWAILRDGASRFQLKTFYINPLAQIQQLEALNFKNIQSFSLATGQLINQEQLATNTDSWIYFLAEKNC